MLMEIVKGKQLCHRTQGQRQLVDQDYRAVGRLFLLDLLIRNTDRLPSRSVERCLLPLTLFDVMSCG